MVKKTIQVVKASGEKEPFDENKVRGTIRRAGIPPQVEEKIVQHIKSQLYNDIPTQKIYRIILDFLDQVNYAQGKVKYSLKQAIMALGPSGYPFERYLGAVLQTQGFRVQTGVELKGACAEHEIDVLLKKDQQQIMVECKFHNRPGTRTDIKVALYVKARFEDLRQGEAQVNQAWLVTNTKFTRRAINYGECAGLYLLGWNYPNHQSLRSLVDQARLYPITSLFALKGEEKRRLLEVDIVLCRDLLTAGDDRLYKLGLSKTTVARARQEAAAVCHQDNNSE